jgi:hypothetical protein
VCDVQMIEVDQERIYGNCTRPNAARLHTDIVQMSGRGLVCAIAPRPTKSGIARPHQNLGGGPGNFARIAPKKRPIIVKFYTLVEFIEAHILVI